MECSRTRPFTPSWPQIENTLGIDLQSYMFDKEDDAQVALDKAAEDVNKILADESKRKLLAGSGYPFGRRCPFY